jgi:hypothetical protein
LGGACCTFDVGVRDNKKTPIARNIKKCEFAKQCLVYMGHVISASEVKIDPAKVDAILKRATPTNIIEVRSCMGATQYLRKFILSFSVAATPLQAMIASGKSFH